MNCELFLGAICILLEDIGFQQRSYRKQNPHDNFPMSYFCSVQLDMGKVFADINHDYTLEMFLNAHNLDVDRWKRQDSGFFMVVDGIDVDIHNPNSLQDITEFVENAIAYTR